VSVDEFFEEVMRVRDPRDDAHVDCVLVTIRDGVLLDRLR
jgi:hypothetical protein